MSPFVIFTITLIVVYLVYYSLLITRDLYGKKGSNRGDEEEFEYLPCKRRKRPLECRNLKTVFYLFHEKIRQKYQILKITLQRYLLWLIV